MSPRDELKHSPAIAIVLGCILALPGWAPVKAAELRPETVRAWDQFVRVVQDQMRTRLRSGAFLWVDEQPGRSQALRRGEILIEPIGTRNPAPVTDGLIHHWVGAAFLPGVSLGDVFSVVRDYNHYKEFYRPIVVDSKPLAHSSADDRFSMLVLNHAVFSKIAMDGDYAGSYTQVSPKRWYSVTQSTRVQEVHDYGEASECLLPEGTGSGFIWRLYSIARFEERDGGVYIELEALALSRDIPGSLRWMVNPIVRRISKSSLLTSLEQTRDAVHTVTAANRYPTGAASTRSAMANFKLSIPMPLALEISK
jgi:hypothetical protein